MYMLSQQIGSTILLLLCR